MKTIIAGGRYYQFSKEDVERLDSIALQITEVVSGTASGADKDGEKWAESKGIKVTRFPAMWEDLTHPDARIIEDKWGRKYDASAGPRRNEAMARYADAVVIFPGKAGTASMFSLAKKLRLIIFDFRKP